MKQITSIFQKTPNQNKSFFLVRMYNTLFKLEEAIDNSKKIGSFKLNFTLLEKLTAEEIKEEQSTMTLKNSIDKKANTGQFNNPEVGLVYCVGSLTNMFLQSINGKPLGAMTIGIYGILRGLNIEKQFANSCIKKLSEGNLMLIISGDPQDIIKLQSQLK